MKKNIFQCEKCAGEKYKSKFASVPVNVANRTLVVNRVAVKECLNCHNLHPTSAGEAKINRCLGSFALLLSDNFPKL
ncbi:MAG: hypothetical protein HQK53_19345 [Oligoflexia bacterium]|nr:hypothetical protein [Oligoflexia bacterium]